MRKIILSQAIVLCSFLTGFTQSFVPGTVITAEGDSLKGLIRDYLNRTPREIVFKKSEAETEGTTYTPQQIKGFALHSSDERFISANIDVDKKPVDLSHLESDRFPKFVKSWVFIKLIAGGEASLYYLQDEDRKEHYFLQVDGGPIEELQYIVYLYKPNSQTEWEVFKEQLKQKLIGCAKTADYRSAHYTASSLKKVVNTYNECLGKSNYTEAKQKRRVSPYIMAAFASGSGAYSGKDAFISSVSQTSNITFPSSTSPVLGLGIEAFSRKNKFALAFEFNYRNHSFVGTDDQGDDVKTTELGFNIYQLNTMASYHFKGGSVKPYLRAGPTLGIVSQTKNHMTVNRRVGVPPITYTVYDGPVNQQISNASTFNNSVGVMASAGATIGRIGAEVRYELIPINSTGAKFTISDISLVVLFRFGKN